jgi:hypothetical protein
MRCAFSAVALACTVFTSSAFADLNWDLQLQQPSIGVIGAHDAAYGRATLYNLATSTSILDLSAPHGFEIKPVYRDTAFSFDYQRNFGNGDTFPWTSWTNSMNAIRLAPGESVSFDYFWIAPVSSAAVAAGNYSVKVDMCLGTGFGCSGLDTRSVTLDWSVSSVPEPATALMLTLGTALVGYSTRRQRKSPHSHVA